MCETAALSVERHAREVVTGWALALWALATGFYLTVGGAKGLTSPAYSLLMRTLHHHNEWVGVALLAAGTLHVIAVIARHNLLTAAAALLCGLWCAAISFYMGWAAATVPGAGNLNAFTAALGAIFFFIRFLSYRRPQLVRVK